jgi:Spy/CpxP family protein refolding chaperone
MKKKAKYLGVIVIALGLLLTAQTLKAQGPMGGPLAQDKRKEVREEIETLKMWKMLEVLDLSSKQSDEFLPAWRELHESQSDFREKREKLFRELEAVLGEEQKTRERGIREVLTQLDKERSRLEEAQQRYRAKTEGILTLEQQAKLLLFEERFEGRMMEMIRKYRGRKGFEQ